MAIPPDPNAYPNSPPPPTPSQRLVGQSGFTPLYEGTSLFDAPILVYWAKDHGLKRDFHITDHFDRPLGEVSEGRDGFAGEPGTMTLSDAVGTKLTRMSYDRRSMELTRVSQGPTDAGSDVLCRIKLSGGQIRADAGGRYLGSATNRALLNSGFGRYQILDHNRRKVGESWAQPAPIGHRRVNYVVSIDWTMHIEYRWAVLHFAPIIRLLRGGLDNNNGWF